MAKRKKVQKDKQRSTKHTHKTNDQVTRTPLKTGGELMCSGRVGSSCSNSGNRRVNPDTNRVISHDMRKGRGSVYDKWKKSLKIPKGGNQNPYIEEEQTTKWQKDPKGVIRIRTSKKNRQHNGKKIPKG